MKTKTISSLFPAPFFFLLFVGCGIFDLRDPEEPAPSRSTYTQPFSPENVKDNIAAAYYDINPVNFENCLGLKNSPDSYLFIASPELQPNISPLNREDEVKSFSGLIADLIPSGNSKERIAVQWSDAKLTDQIDSAEWSANYTLRVPLTSTDLSQNFEGKIILNLKRSDNLWYVSRWRDFSVSGEFCWSQLKQRFR